VSPVVELGLRAFEDAKVGFVDQRGGLQGVAGPLLAQMPAGDAM